MKLVKKELIIKSAPFKECHASTIVLLGGGDKLCAWFGGEKEGKNDVRIWYSRQVDGIWSAPTPIPAVLDLPHWNPVLFETAKGEITLFYKVGVSVPQWRTYFCVTRDGGETWSSPKELMEGEEGGGGRGPVKNKCFVHSSGTLLAPASDERGVWRSFIDRFDGEKWQKCPIPVSEEMGRVHMIQPTLWESEDGCLHALMRTMSSFIYRSDSSDGGKTWCAAYKTDIPNNNSGIDCVKAEDGAIYLVCNPIPPHRIRSPLSILVSSDGGNTFEKALDLETEMCEFSYPAIVSNGNKLHVTYTYGRTNIAYAEIEL